MSKRIPQKPKPRLHKELFEKDSPYGHKVQRDKTKYKRKDKYPMPSPNYEGPWGKDLGY